MSTKPSQEGPHKTNVAVVQGNRTCGAQWVCVMGGCVEFECVSECVCMGVLCVSVCV